MRIALIGASGQIGTFIHAELTRRFAGEEILALSRSNKPGFVQFDPMRDNWSRLENPDVLINAAGIISEQGDETFERVHIELSKKIAGNITPHTKIIQISILGADKNSKSRFSSTKALADEIILRHNNSLIFRPSIVCTPGTMIVTKFKFLQKLSMLTAGYLPVPHSMLVTKIQPVMGTDLAALIAESCVNDRTGVFEIGGPEIFTLNEIFTRYLKLKTIPVSDKFMDPLMKLITKVFPSVINRDQYLMLKKDNVLFNSGINGIKLETPTDSFWHSEFKK